MFEAIDHLHLPKHMSRALVILLETNLKSREQRSQTERSLKIPSQTDEKVLERPMNLYSEEWRELWTLVQTSMGVLNESNVSGNEGLHKLASLVQCDRTGCLPFREKAPELQRARGERGFYHWDAVKTTAGIFSALVWRVISLNTSFAKEHRMTYTDDKDYLKEIKSCQPGAYVCKPNAYGHPIPHSGPLPAKKFWKSLTDVVKWDEFTRSQQSFDDCLAYFRGRDGKKNLFPGLGNLLSFSYAIYPTQECAHLQTSTTCANVSSTTKGGA